MFTPGPDGTPSSDDQQAISLPVRTRPAGRRAVAGAREPAREQSGARSRDEYAEMAPLLEELHREDDPARRADLRDEAVVCGLPLANHIARRFADRGEPFEDLEQVARIGLIKAVDRFDTDRGANFLAFAVPTVMGEVRRHFRDVMWAMRVPRRTKEAALRFGGVHDELAQRLGRSPRPSEIAAHLRVPVDEVIDGLLARSAYSADSLDAQSAVTEGRALVDTLGDDDPGYALVDEFESLRPAIAELSERDQRTLSLRFFASMSQSEVAVRLGISQMHVSRLLTRILDQLRQTAGAPESPPAGTDTGRRR